jgi:hypothetical protein
MRPRRRWGAQICWITFEIEMRACWTWLSFLAGLADVCLYGPGPGLWGGRTL